jgi:hypothetical protein
MNHANPFRRQSGQSIVEYAVVCVALAAALLVPVPGIQPPQTVGQLLAGKIHDLYDNLTFFLSLP